jgi:hypothetical protein
MIISAVFWLVTVAVVAIFVARAWTPARRSSARSRTRSWRRARAAGRTQEESGRRQRDSPARSREVLVRSGVDAVVLLAMVRALFPPPVSASWLWVGAVVAVGVGVAGVIVRWRGLPSSRRCWTTVAYAMVGAGLVVVLA